MRRGTVVGGVLVLAVVAIAAVGLARFRTVHPTGAELEQVPGARATYPGARVLERQVRDGDRNLVAVNHAYVRTAACTNTDASRVRAWFATELGRKRWVRTFSGTPHPGAAGPETDDGWQRGGRSFELRTFDRTQLPGASGCTRGYVTVLQ